MPNMWTFTIKPIKELLAEEIQQGQEWVDPFAGMNSPALITNDINTNRKAIFHMDAVRFLKTLPNKSFDGVLVDWPYSNNQYRECYLEAGMPINTEVFNAHYQAQIKDETARVLKVGGKAIVFGWNSNGIGKKRGMELERILLVAHGRMHNDTIVTVERKI